VESIGDHTRLFSLFDTGACIVIYGGVDRLVWFR